MNYRLPLIITGAAIAVGAVVITVRARRSSGPRTSLSAEQRSQLLTAINGAFEATRDAFATDGDVDFEARDARAAESAANFASTRATLEAELGAIGEPCSSFAAIVDQSQLQLMAFAINRKNRGLPVGAEAEAERADRTAFLRDAEPLYRVIVASLT